MSFFIILLYYLLIYPPNNVVLLNTLKQVTVKITALHLAQAGLFVLSGKFFRGFHPIKKPAMN